MFNLLVPAFNALLMACLLPRAFSLARHLQKVQRAPVPLSPARLQRGFHGTARLAFSKETDKDDEEMDELKKNPYYEKYADKIAKLQQ